MASALSHTEQPLRVVERWLAQAAESGTWRNPNAMALATAGPDARPAVRMVLLKGIEPVEGYVVFYTHYGSRKGRELEQNDWAAGALYWESYGRQVRLEGRVLRSPPEESDAYFASRPLASRLNAWASRQSQPLGDMSELQRRAEDKARELGLSESVASFGLDGADASSARILAEAGAVAEPAVPRPPSWGGYRLWCAAVELWIEGRGRFHERIRYERELTPSAGGYLGGVWRSRRLQP
ncbi:MAG TPA: pyridoxal 5'-phosphate synthase [Gammaproteobacteria bacterium]|nr:pyridoxal 5'-phosphate synthase [Gammaproteobacteria bacterium]